MDQKNHLDAKSIKMKKYTSLIIFILLAISIYKQVKLTDDVLKKEVVKNDSKQRTVKIITRKYKNQTKAAENLSFSLNSCLNMKVDLRSTKLNDLIYSLSSRYQKIKKYIDIENFHINLLSGEERRIQLITEISPNGMVSRELRYYKLDNEGFPYKLKIPDVHIFNPSDETIGLYKRKGVEFFNQEIGTLSSNEIDASYTSENGSINELEISTNGRLLKCYLELTAYNCDCI